MKRLFDGIAKEMGKEAFLTKESWQSKSAWHEMMQSDDIGNLINVNKAIFLIQRHVDSFCRHLIENRTGGSLFCVLRKASDKGVNPEDRLERMLVTSVPALHNRFNFLSGLTEAKFNHQTKHMTVDLVEIDAERKLEAFIELKASESHENPLSALCQVIMYFYLFDAVRNRYALPVEVAHKLKLFVLAPNEYYSNFGKNRDAKVYRHIMSSLPIMLQGMCQYLKLAVNEDHSADQVANAYKNAKELKCI